VGVVFKCIHESRDLIAALPLALADSHLVVIRLYFRLRTVIHHSFMAALELLNFSNVVRKLVAVVRHLFQRLLYVLFVYRLRIIALHLV